MAVAPFREIERSYFDLRWHLDPVGATQAGVKTYDDRYGRFSPSALAPHLAALKSIASTLEETTADEREDEIDRTALLNEIRVTLRRFERERPQAKNPGFWLSQDRKSTRLNSSHGYISYAVFCLKKKKI